MKEKEQAKPELYHVTYMKMVEKEKKEKEKMRLKKEKQRLAAE